MHRYSLASTSKAVLRFSSSLRPTPALCRPPLSAPLPAGRRFTMSSVPLFPPPHLVPTAEDEAQLAAQEKARASASSSSQGGAEESEGARRERLALPSPEEVARMAEKEGGKTLDMSQGGGSISFDELGPVVVNENGTLSRIHNWGEMSPIERANTMRIIGKRNKQRIERLKKAQEEEERREGAQAGGTQEGKQA